jgi:hypothetical protein
MSTQIFKNSIPNEELFGLLEKICLKNEKHYTFTLNSFKKGIYTSDIPNFIIYCNPFYHISKRKYLDRKITYNSFTTILRQICNFNQIKYTSEIKYDKSSYTILYHIYLQ